MWRDITEEEIKYLNKVVFELKNKRKLYRNIMIASYIILMFVLFFTNSIRFKYLFEILEFISINPFMWIYVYSYYKIDKNINCLSEIGYTKCADVKILELFPEDSSKNAQWFANVKSVQNDQIMEKIPCYNGNKVNKFVLQKGIYAQGILIDLSGKNTKDDKKKDYLVYDLSNI